MKEEIKIGKQYEDVRYEKRDKLLLIKACEEMEYKLLQKEQNIVQKQIQQDKMEQKLLQDETFHEVKELRYLQKKTEQEEKEQKLQLKETYLMEKERNLLHKDAEQEVNTFDNTHNISNQTGTRPKCNISDYQIEDSTLKKGTKGWVLIGIIASFLR